MDLGTTVKNRPMNIVIIVISGTAGIAALLLPFTWGVSPMDVVLFFYRMGPDNLRLLLIAIPFLLSVLISAAFARWMISGCFSRTERAIGYVVSSMMASATLCFVGLAFLEGFRPSVVREWITLAIPFLTLLIVVYIAIKNFRNNGAMDTSVVMAMQFAYLGNAFMCLIVFYSDSGWGGWDIGAYFVIVTSGAYIIQIFFATLKPCKLWVNFTNSHK